jgi:hypothetical protein
MSETRYWIGVASREHVLRGVAGGFCQLNHGKAGPIKRLKPGDWIIYYSPRETMKDGEPVQAFTAIGKIKPGEPYVGEMGGGMEATRRDVDFVKAREAAIGPLLETLSFTKGRASWGVALRRGSLAVTEADFHAIADAMGLSARVRGPAASG